MLIEHQTLVGIGHVFELVEEFRRGGRSSQRNIQSSPDPAPFRLMRRFGVCRYARVVQAFVDVGFEAGELFHFNTEANYATVAVLTADTGGNH